MLPLPLPHQFQVQSWLGVLTLLVALVFLPASSAAAAVANLTAEEGRGCSTVLRRQEWRTLDPHQKKEYINAVQCLQRLPAISLFPGVKTRFDDFQALHINLTERVHLVGQFLPWHRRFVSVYESSLRNECGYRGANPYWDWTKDSKNLTTLLNSPLFDPTTGFGNSPYPLPGPIKDGPFASYTLSFGPGPHLHTHPLTRGLNASLLPYLTPAQVHATMREGRFEGFRVELEGAPVTEGVRIHDAGHRLVGGDMGDTYSSPGDPLFFLHHANLDRIWWEWQMADPGKRLYEVSGRTSVNPPYRNVTLEYVLEMGMLAPGVRIREVMDVRRVGLCYVYV